MGAKMISIDLNKIYNTHDSFLMNIELSISTMI